MLFDVTREVPITREREHRQGLFNPESHHDREFSTV